MHSATKIHVILRFELMQRESRESLQTPERIFLNTSKFENLVISKETRQFLAAEVNAPLILQS